MGTRSVVARPTDDGFKGRYIHWDGYPTGVGASLLAIVQRDGVDKALETLTDLNYGWSNLDEEHPAVFSEHGGKTDPGHGDGRFRAVENYGTSYTTVSGQSHPDEWITDTSDDWGTEWAYVLYPFHMVVLERVWNDGGHMTGMFGVGAAEGDGTWRIIGEVIYSTSDADRLNELEERAARLHATEEVS